MTKIQYTPRENPVAGHNSERKASKVAIEALLILGAVFALVAVVAFAVTAVVLLNSAFLIGSGIAVLILLGTSGGAAKVHTGHVFRRPINPNVRRPVDSSWEPLSPGFGATHSELFGSPARVIPETRGHEWHAEMATASFGSPARVIPETRGSGRREERTPVVQERVIPGTRRGAN